MLKKEYINRCYKNGICYVDTIAYMRELSKYYPNVENVMYDIIDNCKFDGLEFVIDPNGAIFLVDARVAQLVRDAIEHGLKIETIIHHLSTVLSKLPLKY